MPPPDMPTPLPPLSPRQRQCLRMVAQGMEAKEIGRALGISDMTVKNHLSAARTALGVTRSIDAARLIVAAEGTSAWGTSASPGIEDRTYVSLQGPGLSDPGEGLADGGIVPPPPPSLPLPFPTRRGQRNDLGIAARLALVVVLTVLLVAAVGFFVQASRGLRF